MTSERVDVCVVGAGPAGAATALHLRRSRPDLRVVLLDRASFPRDKVCGDAISPDGVEELRRMDALAILDGYSPVRSVRVRAVSGREVAGIPPRDGYVVPRVVFDARLVAHATAAGAQLRRERVRRLEAAGDTLLVNTTIAADVVVGADGAHSTVRRLLGVPPNARTRTLIAVRGYARQTPYPDDLFLGWTAAGGAAYAWSFPIGVELANVGFGLPLHRLGGGRAELEQRLDEGLGAVSCLPRSLMAHHLPLSSGRPVPYRGRALLVGDAASLINPLTGEGIFYALASGRLAAEAITAAPDDPGPRYAATLHRELGRHFRHTRWLAATCRWPAASDLLVTAAGDPAVLDDVADIAFGKGTLSPQLAVHVARGWLRQRARTPALRP